MTIPVYMNSGGIIYRDLRWATAGQRGPVLTPAACVDVSGIRPAPNDTDAANSGRTPTTGRYATGSGTADIHARSKT